MGLAHGIKKFDPERGYALSTYVYWWIRQSVSRYLSCSDRVIRLPSHAVEMLAKIRAWSPTFQESHGRMPTLEECAEYCKTSPERMRLYMDNANDSISLDSRVSAMENDSALIDLVAGESNLMEDLELVVRADFIDQMLAALGAGGSYSRGWDTLRWMVGNRKRCRRWARLWGCRGSAPGRD